ncbi:RWD domain-containing protein 1-like isoform X2 [Ornithodoros turicata]
MVTTSLLATRTGRLHVSAEMTDFKEEQRNEIEALDSIYPNELQILSDDPYHIFTIDVRGETVGEEEPLCVTLKFTYVPTYPEEGPVIEVIEGENIEDEDTKALMSLLLSEIEDNLGMAMIFSLVSAASEWLTTHAENIRVRKEEEEKRKHAKEEEVERAKFEGTRVTVECFLAWKEKFDAEMSELYNKEKETAGNRKLTGRELFERDQNLIDSDLQFMQEGEEDVKVDESLFQELDDLDLQDLGDGD